LFPKFKIDPSKQRAALDLAARIQREREQAIQEEMERAKRKMFFSRMYH